MSKRIQDFPGNFDTTYDAWANFLVNNFPDYQLKNNGDVVECYYDNEKIAEYDFKESRGFVEINESPENPCYRFQQYEKIDKHKWLKGVHICE